MKMVAGHLIYVRTDVEVVDVNFEIEVVDHQR